MKRLLAIIVCLLHTVTAVYAQPRFSKFINGSLSTPPATSIYNTAIADSGRFIVNGITNSGTLSTYNSYIAGINYNGQVTWRKNLFFPGHYNAVSGNHSLVQWSRNTMLMAGVELDTATRDSMVLYQPWLYFFSNNGDSLHFYKYTDNFRSRIINALTRTASGQIIAGGLSYSHAATYQPGGYIADSVSLFLSSFDSAGTLLWQKEFFSHYNNLLFPPFISQIIPADDGGVVIAGFATDMPGVAGMSHIFMHADSSGNILWQRNYRPQSNYPETFLNSNDGITRAADGGYYFLAEMATLPAGPGGPGNSLLYYGRLNMNGDTLWTKHFADTGAAALGGYKYTQATAITQRSNGDLLLSGHTYFDGYDHPLLVIADSNGRTKSYRTYIFIDSSDATQQLVTLHETPQKNILLTGSAALYHTVPNIWDTAGGFGWIIQTDSFGCITSGCQAEDVRWLGIPQHMTETAITMVYPNPGKDQMNIKTGQNINRILVTDLNGSTILEQKASSTITQIATGDFAPGLYFIQCYQQRQLICVLKWSKI